jgi:hypothetical protein
MTRTIDIHCNTLIGITFKSNHKSIDKAIKYLAAVADDEGGKATLIITIQRPRRSKDAPQGK